MPRSTTRPSAPSRCASSRVRPLLSDCIAALRREFRPWRPATAHRVWSPPNWARGSATTSAAPSASSLPAVRAARTAGTLAALRRPGHALLRRCRASIRRIQEAFPTSMPSTASRKRAGIPYCPISVGRTRPVLVLAWTTTRLRGLMRNAPAGTRSSLCSGQRVARSGRPGEKLRAAVG